MNALEADERLETADAERADPLIDQPDPEIYLPGTPTVSFLEYVDIAVRSLRR